jgi:hypothetical protein
MSGDTYLMVFNLFLYVPPFLSLVLLFLETNLFTFAEKKLRVSYLQTRKSVRVEKINVYEECASIRIVWIVTKFVKYNFKVTVPTCHLSTVIITCIMARKFLKHGCEDLYVISSFILTEYFSAFYSHLMEKMAIK